MNKFYITLALMLAFVWVSAQNMTPRVNSNSGIKHLQSIDMTAANLHMKAMKQRSTKEGSTWFHQPTAFSIFNTSADGSYYDYYAVSIFPDTTMLWGADPTDHLFIHSLAISLDPAAEVWDNEDWNSNTTYTMDSVAVGYIYSRNTAASVVDTLVMQIQVNDWQYTLTSTDYAWVQDIYHVPTMKVAAILHDTMSWEYTGDDIIGTFKFLLTEDDTSSMGAYLEKALGTPLSFNGGNIIKASFTFVPGYTWTPNADSIDMYNKFGMLTFGNASNNDYPTYSENDYNTNQVMTTWHYRDNTRDAYSPVFFYTNSPFPYQYHDVLFKLNSLNTSISNNEALNLSVSQNMPNPFSGNSTINYSLTEKSEVSFEVFDVTGSKVMELNEGVKTAGNHSIQINASNLNAGVYYYSVVAGDKRITKKMIVY